MANKAILEILDTLHNQGEYRITFIGDSITSTEWEHPNWRGIFEYILKEELIKEVKDWKLASWGVRCFNYAYDGGTTRDFLNRLEMILSLNSHMIIGLVGGCERAEGIAPEEHGKNLDLIVERIKKSGSKFVFASTTPGLTDYQKLYPPFEPFIREVIEKHNLEFLDLFHELQEYDLSRFYTFKTTQEDAAASEGIAISAGSIDYVHPNQLGNAYIAKHVLQRIFGIGMDPELYIKDTLAGEKYPRY